MCTKSYNEFGIRTPDDEISTGTRPVADVIYRTFLSMVKGAKHEKAVYLPHVTVKISYIFFE